MNSIELEIQDISSYPGDLKSLAGIADFEEENVLLSPEATIISSGEIQIDGCPVYVIVYSQGIPNTLDEWKIMQTFLVESNKEYVMRFTATDSEKYDKYSGTVNNMFQTFKIGGC